MVDDAPEQEDLAWTDGAPDQVGLAWTEGAADQEVRVRCYGEQLIARNGYNIRMSLEDCIQTAAFLRAEDLALFLEMTVELQRKLDVSKMTDDAQRVFNTENAGGSSELSEAFSMELLARTLGARLDKTELELEYFTGNGSASKITDYSIVLDDCVIGVSVTRACKGWPCVPGAYTLEDATRLLSKKLLGVNESTKHVFNATWKKQLLHCFVPDASLMPVLHEAAERISPALIANTVVLFTLCSGAHGRDLFKKDELSQPTKKKSRTSLGHKSADHLHHLLASDPCMRQAFQSD
jgi:hypothetical protein